MEINSPMGENLNSRAFTATKWLMIYSRPLIFGLLALNLMVAGGLTIWSNSSHQDALQISDANATFDPQNDLLLLSESVPSQQKSQTSGTTPESDADVKECRVWGPQSDQEAFAELSSTLDSMGGFPKLVEVEIAADPTHMVFIDVRDGSIQARQVMQELSAVGIDNYRITREDGDVISVGVFSNQDLAEKQLQRISDLGYASGLESMQRNQTVYTLEGYVQSDSELHDQSSHECGKQGHLQVSQH